MLMSEAAAHRAATSAVRSAGRREILGQEFSLAAAFPKPDNNKEKTAP
jgi:hypothetical protein